MVSVFKGKIFNWVIGNYDNVRVGSRLGEDKRYVMNIFVFILFGVAIIYYGEEIGMLDVNIINLSDYRYKERIFM